jgi:hypothetical protein
MSKILRNHAYTDEVDVVQLFGSFVIGGTGAVGTVKGGGIKGVTRSATGVYEVELDQPWNRLLFSAAGFVHATNSGVAATEVRENPANLQSDFAADNKYKFVCKDFAGADVDPASGSVCSFCVWVRKSSVAFND